MRIPLIVPRQLHVFEAAELLDRVSGKGHELGFIVAVIAPKMAQRMIGGGIGRSRLAGIGSAALGRARRSSFLVGVAERAEPFKRNPDFLRFVGAYRFVPLLAVAHQLEQVAHTVPPPDPPAL